MSDPSEPRGAATGQADARSLAAMLSLQSIKLRALEARVTELEIRAAAGEEEAAPAAPTVVAPIAPPPSDPAPALRHPDPASLAVLPGGGYESVLLPLDYPPSRDLRPRWGWGRPPHRGLEALFATHDEDYRRIARELQELRPRFAAIPDRYPSEAPGEPGWKGGPITPLDCALLYRFIARSRPRTYVEIGSGVTTCFARRAARDMGLPTRIVSIDPQPRSEVDAICDTVIRRGLETMEDLGLFEALEPGDIVFMDGSHRSFMNSDVTVFMLDVLPLLRPGVLVHVHDIHLPFDYHADFSHWYWNEQYLLATYLLASRDHVEVLMPSMYLASAPGLRASLLPSPVPCVGDDEWRYGGSLWFTHRDPGGSRP